MADSDPLPPDGFVDGHSGSELPPDGFVQTDHPGNKFLDMVKQTLLNIAPDNTGLNVANRMVNNPPTIDPNSGVIPNALSVGGNLIKNTFGGVSDAMQSNPISVAGQGASKFGEWEGNTVANLYPNAPAIVPWLAKQSGSLLANPMTYMGMAGNPIGKAASVAGSAIEGATPEIMAKVANTSEEVAQRMNLVKDLFTKYGGKEGDLEAATRNIQNALEEAITKYGTPLNQAKKEAGLPVDVMEKLGNLATTGNTFGVAKTEVEGGAANGPAATLAADIQGFLATHHLMAPADRNVQGSALLDRINQEVKWGEHGDEVGGVFKDAYGKISRTLPDDLQQAKGAMSQALQVYGDLQKKLAEGTGAAQSWLEKVFESSDPAFKDYRKALANLQILTGHPVAEDFLNQLASNRLQDSNWLNAVKQSSLGVTGAVVSASFHHPLGAAVGAGTALTMAGLRSPAVVSRALPALASGLAQVGTNKMTPILSGLLASLSNNQVPSKLEQATTP